jgi:hypothetical protein
MIVVAALALVAAAADPVTYEDDRLAAVIAERGAAPVAPAPAARIAFVDVVVHDVFTEHDPFPDFLNVLHVTTFEDVVRRELLFDVDDPFDARMEDSARALRAMFVFSLVRIVPVARADGAVGVLVFVRDLWSLRFEQGFQVTGLEIDRLSLALTERNVLGRAKVASARFGMTPTSWSLGELYVDRRLFGSDLALLESFDVLFSRATSAPEGFAGELFVGAPLWTFEPPWGYGASVAADVRVVRQLEGRDVLVYDAPETAVADDARRAWDQRAFSAELFVRRQFRSFLVHRPEVGVAASDLYVAPNAETALNPEAAEAFARDVLPKARRQIFPYVTWQSFAATHARYDDLDTFGQTEAVRLGPAVATTIGGGTRALFSSTDFVFLAGAAGVAFAPWHGLVDAGIDVGARLEDGAIVNRYTTLRFRAATPAVLFGRLLGRADATLRRDDTSNTLVSLGGDAGLRGYPARAFTATSASTAQATLEWRSLPLEWSSVHVGFALFYDAGLLVPTLAEQDVMSRAAGLHSVGFGVRVLFPQFNRTVYRIDFGVPLDDLGPRILFSLGDTQAVEHGRGAIDRLEPRP